MLVDISALAMNHLLDLVYLPRDQWDDSLRARFSEALRERYPHLSDLTEKNNGERKLQLRLNAQTKDGSVPYAALIAPDQELSGGYGGMSFVMFPADAQAPGAPALIGMVVGTHGLAPDETVLGRPGHARKCAGIASWLNVRAPGAAWAKREPVRIDLDVPSSMQASLSAWKGSLERYGRVLYATFAPPAERTPDTDQLVIDALTAFLDLFFDERGIAPKKDHRQSAEDIRRAWLARVLPATSEAAVAELLAHRRFAVVEGPPGTGKTDLAIRLLRERYGGRGRIIQFHPGTTYESFVGGLAPRSGGALGFTFEAVPGHLMQAAAMAMQAPDQPWLLVIDEINRADLSKVLGEAIHLFEPDRHDREITLAHDFPGTGSTLRLPPNLHVLGTMNSADRSIAILDVAVRRRFAFVPLWPQLSVVEAGSGATLRDRFQELLRLFVEHAPDDSLALAPGHAYFLGDEAAAASRMATGVRPLLEEYLAQGYVSGFADEIRAYIDRYAPLS